MQSAILTAEVRTENFIDKANIFLVLYISMALHHNNSMTL